MLELWRNPRGYVRAPTFPSSLRTVFTQLPLPPTPSSTAPRQNGDAMRLRFEDSVTYCMVSGIQAATSLAIIKASISLLSVRRRCTFGTLACP